MISDKELDQMTINRLSIENARLRSKLEVTYKNERKQHLQIIMLSQDNERLLYEVNSLRSYRPLRESMR